MILRPSPEAAGADCDGSGPEPSTSSSGYFPAYSYRLYPPSLGGSKSDGQPPPPDRFSPGETVFVQLRSQRETGRAEVLEASPPSGSGSGSGRGGGGDGRYLLRYLDGSGTHRVRPGRISRVFGGPGSGPTVLVAATTDHFRRLARSQLSPEDGVLDVGCNVGDGTAVMAQHASGSGRVAGVDIGGAVIEAARAKHGPAGIRFEVLDALSPLHRNRLRALAREVRCTAVFLDVGGNRELPVLAALVPALLGLIGPRLMVVKSEALRAHADAHARKQLKRGQQRQPEAVGADAYTYELVGPGAGALPWAREWWDALVADVTAAVASPRAPPPP